MAFRLCGLALICCSVVCASAGASAGSVRSHAMTASLIAGDTPKVVANGKAMRVGAVSGSAQLRLNVGLAIRKSAQLDALIKAASTPGNPNYGHYISQADYQANYAPTVASVGWAPVELRLEIPVKLNAYDPAIWLCVTVDCKSSVPLPVPPLS